MPSGKLSRNCPRETIGAGTATSLAPTMSPMIALPPICCQRLSVVRSYMTRSLFRSRPETPNSNVAPFSTRS